MQKIKTVAIIGVGLIGGSLGMALKKSRAVVKVIGVGRDPAKLKKAKKLGAIDELFTDFQAGVKEADLVVVCTPVGLIAPTIKKILPALKQGCVITDVGSVKAPILNEVEKILRHQKVHFIGGHPMAGSEQAGISNAQSHLFKKAVWVLTPAEHTSLKNLAGLHHIIRRTGARVVLLNPQTHDRIVSVTSHVPHLLAANLVNFMQEQDRKNKNTAKLTASGFRDMTRIASSTPEIWADISLMNKEEIIKTIGEFNRLTRRMLSALQANKRKEVFRFFAQAKQTRDRMFK
ncbi:MAG: prephenate dehydrogenase/arogenate dehydrogenase family protein [Elusimicrobia bacterium]|nr:prephenate dehydrogenase/arogenate dehydrogenase family protein [Elusimicrobiota bacterium]